MGKPASVEIKEIFKETPKVKTFLLNITIEAKPGNFIMIWIPGVDEIPMAISSFDPLGITVEKLGDATQALHRKEEGDLIGVRGPFGRSFEITGEKIILVAGGVGIAPLVPLPELYEKEFTVLLGAKKKEELIFLDRLRENSSVEVSTDDGSLGYKGYVTDLYETHLKTSSYDLGIACGPEPMMYKSVQISMKNNIPCQISLHRYIKCGIGLCGQCCVDTTGWRVCKEGPVFWDKELELIKEFNKYRRGPDGRKIKRLD